MIEEHIIDTKAVVSISNPRFNPKNKISKGNSYEPCGKIQGVNELQTC